MQNTMKIKLKLEKLGVQDTKPAEPGQDNWLDNDDSALLGDIESTASDDDNALNLNNIIDKISENPAQKIYKVNALEIQATDGGYTLLTDAGHLLLEDGDIIAMGENALKVTLIKENVVAYEGPVRKEETDFSAPDVNDIWSTPAANNTTANRFIDPFAAAPARAPNPNMPTMSPPTQSPMQQDPLDFLYPNAHNQRAQMDNLLPGAPHNSMPGTAIPAILPYDQVPTTNMHLASMPAPMDALDVNTQAGYTPAASQQTLAAQQTHNQQATTQGGEGDILKDLGINGDNASIANKDYGNGAHNPLTDQSPMDMLDEYLTDDTAQFSNQAQMARAQPSYPPQAQYAQQPFGGNAPLHNATKPKAPSFRAALKKLLG